MSPTGTPNIPLGTTEKSSLPPKPYCVRYISKVGRDFSDAVRNQLIVAGVLSGLTCTLQYKYGLLSKESVRANALSVLVPYIILGIAFLIFHIGHAALALHREIQAESRLPDNYRIILTDAESAPAPRHYGKTITLIIAAAICMCLFGVCAALLRVAPPLVQPTSSFQRVAASGDLPYSEYALYGALGYRKGMAWNGIITNPTRLDGWDKDFVSRSEGKIVCNCTPAAIHICKAIIVKFPNYPFAYYFLSLCLKKAGDPSWREYAQTAKEIFEKTTEIDNHHHDHDLIFAEVGRLLSDARHQVAPPKPPTVGTLFKSDFPALPRFHLST